MAVVSYPNTKPSVQVKEIKNSLEYVVPGITWLEGQKVKTVAIAQTSKPQGFRRYYVCHTFLRIGDAKAR